jgi:hypothetical protein
MDTPTAPRPSRPGLPLWIKIILVLGGLAAALALLIFVLPMALMFYFMGSGDQVDTRGLMSDRSVAVLHFEPDFSDPGTAAFFEHLADVLPEFQARMRRAQGYPEWVTQLESMQSGQNSQAGIRALMPTQATVTLEQGSDEAAEPGMLGAVNLSAWARGIKLGMWAGARMQQEVAEDDPEVQPVQRVEVDDHTLYVQRSSKGEVFWGSVDSTILGGAGSFLGMEGAMERMVAGEVVPLEPGLQATVDALGGGPWACWGAIAYMGSALDTVFPEPAELEGLDQAELEALEAMLEDGEGAIPSGLDAAGADADEPVETPPAQRSCLAELEDGQGLAFGLDVVGADALELRLVATLGSEPGMDAAEACLASVCEGRVQDLAEEGMELSCSTERRELAVLTTARISGIEIAIERWLDEVQVEAERQRLGAERQRAYSYDDLQDIEGLEL